MKFARSALTLCCLSLFALDITARAEVQVQPDKENVVASKLDGNWEPDADLTKALGGSAMGPVSFVGDAKVASRVPEKFEKFLKDKHIYLAGTMTVKETSHPFLLIEHKGNPHLLYFRARDGDPLGDVESFNLMLVVAKETRNDLLFIGGDFNNQPFAAYRRVGAKGLAK